MRENSTLASLVVVLLLVLTGCSAATHEKGPESQAAVVPIAPTPLVPIGFAGGASLLFVNDADLARSLDAVVATGSTRLRLDLAWPLIEPSQGTFAWSMTDRVVDAARARGLSVLGIIDYSPTWAAKVPSAGPSSEPANAQDFADFAGIAAQHFLGRVSAYEVWNEPNGTLFWKPAPDADLYSQLLIRSYKTIKAADPSAVVIGGVLGAVVDTATTSDGLAFLKRMYANGVQGSFDALSVHPYTTADALIAGTGPLYPPMPMVAEMRRAMVAAGDADKKLWATEFGGPTVAGTGGTEDQQAKLIHNFVRQWSELPYAGPVYIHEIRDRAAQSTDVEDHYGLLREDFSPKPAYTDLAATIKMNTNDDVDYRSMRAAGRDRPELGDALTPVYHGTDKRNNSYVAQQYLNGTLYRSIYGYFSSPLAVADAVQRSGYVPTTDVRDGQQELDAEDGMRVFYSPDTGAHIVSGEILESWTSDLGFPLADQALSTKQGAPPDEQVAIFEHGTLTWVPGSKPERTAA